MHFLDRNSYDDVQPIKSKTEVEKMFSFKHTLRASLTSCILMVFGLGLAQTLSRDVSCFSCFNMDSFLMITVKPAETNH